MALENAFASAMTTAIYAAAGQSVAYTGSVDGAVSIKVILDSSAEDWPSDFEAQAPEVLSSARVTIADVPSPRRGDTILDADSNTWTVDTYRKLNEQEWTMELSDG